MNTEGPCGSSKATDVFLPEVAAPDEHQPDEQPGECGRGDDGAGNEAADGVLYTLGIAVGEQG